MLKFGLIFLQANHDWGRGAESQRAERHVHWDQCQDRLQCQTGDPCSFATFHSILGIIFLCFSAFPSFLQGDRVGTSNPLGAVVNTLNLASSFSRALKCKLAYFFFSTPLFSVSLFSLSSCFVELPQPYLEWKVWMTQILKAVSFIATVTHCADSQIVKK